MTSQERLSFIEAKFHSKEHVIIVSDRDVEWLISRIRALEAALDKIEKQRITDISGEYRTNASRIARKALAGEE